MKTLLLMRHAKSSWKEQDVADFDRPLNERGLRTAPMIGKLMTEKGLVPEIIVSSPAKRAKDTAVLVKEGGNIDSEIKFEESVYEASPFSLMNIISKVSELSDRVMLIGHNPGLESFIRVLTGEIQPMPTAALAKISLDIGSWADISAGSGTLDLLIRPKEVFAEGE